MIGCLNVLSRLKNPGIRIILPVMDESFGRNSAMLLSHVSTAFNREPEENIGTAERGSDALRYYHDFTARLPTLINIEQFEGFPGRRVTFIDRDIHPNDGQYFQPGKKRAPHPDCLCAVGWLFRDVRPAGRITAEAESLNPALHFLVFGYCRLLSGASTDRFGNRHGFCRRAMFFGIVRKKRRWFCFYFIGSIP